MDDAESPLLPACCPQFCNPTVPTGCGNRHWALILNLVVFSYRKWSIRQFWHKHFTTCMSSKQMHCTARTTRRNRAWSLWADLGCVSTDSPSCCSKFFMVVCSDSMRLADHWLPLSSNLTHFNSVRNRMFLVHHSVSCEASFRFVVGGWLSVFSVDFGHILQVAH